MKPVLSLDQQVRRLEDRGLQVEDRERALSVLSRINYYRLSAYWRPFKRNDDRFHPDGSFDKAIDLYEFDRRLRLAMMDMIERVEVAFRTQVSYRIATLHGPYGHEDPARFQAWFRHDEWLEDLHHDTRRSQETFVSHFMREYEGFPRLPIFVVSEVMSFGCLSLLFKGLNAIDRQALAAPHGVHPKVLESWMHSLVYVRNTCAHHGRLWNRDLPIAPAIPRSGPPWTGEHLPSPKRIHVVLCVLRSLSRGHPCSNEWAASIARLLARFDDEPRWQRAMGLPPGWRESPFWKEVAP